MVDKEYPSKDWEPGWFTKIVEKGVEQYKKIVEILEHGQETTSKEAKKNG